MSYELLIHIGVSIAIAWIGLALGKALNSYTAEYQPITSLFKAENSTGFNAIYRILFAPIAIVSVSIIIYFLGFSSVIDHIWLVALYVALGQMLVLMALGRWRLVNKSKFFLFHLLSVFLSFYLYSQAISKGISHLLPDEANLRSDIWLVVAAFIYGIFKNIPENYLSFERRKESYILNKMSRFKSKYRIVLDNYDEGFCNILLAIMIYEDFNRPYIARVLERIANAKTQYVMQVAGAKNDEDSIKVAAESLKDAYERFHTSQFVNEWERESALRSLFSLHNPYDSSYGERAKDIYKVITK